MLEHEISVFAATTVPVMNSVKSKPFHQIAGKFTFLDALESYYRATNEINLSKLKARGFDLRTSDIYRSWTVVLTGLFVRPSDRGMLNRRVIDAVCRSEKRRLGFE